MKSRRKIPHQQLPENNPKAVNVRTRRSRLSTQHLGSQVAECSRDGRARYFRNRSRESRPDAAISQCFFSHNLPNPKIGDEDMDGIGSSMSFAFYQ